MKRGLVAFIVLAALSWALSAWADRKDITKHFTIAPIRSVTSSLAMQQVYDTLNVSEGTRINLLKFVAFADDSAQTPTLRIRFMSKNSRTLYLQLAETYSAAQIRETEWTPNFCFPYDSSIVIHYYIPGAAIGTLDTLTTGATYQIERER